MFKEQIGFFAWSIEEGVDQKHYKKNYLPTVEIKNHNVMINGRNFFDQPVKNDLRIYNNIRKIASGQGDDYTTGCLLISSISKNIKQTPKTRCWSESNTTN